MQRDSTGEAVRHADPGEVRSAASAPEPGPLPGSENGPGHADQLRRLVAAATRIFHVPAGLMVACEESNLTLRACWGVEFAQLPEEIALLAYSVLRDGARVVADARVECAFCRQVEAGVRMPLGFYAAVPFSGSDGNLLGVLFVLDSEPQPGCTSRQMKKLKTIASRIGYEEELYRWREQMKTLAGEHKRQMDQLRRSHDRYRLAAQANSDGLWEWDIDSGSVYYSSTWQAICGGPAEELSAGLDHWLNRVHPEDQERVRDELQAYRLGETAVFRSEHRLQHARGEWKWVLTRAVLETGEDGTSARIGGTLTDVTAGKTADPLTGMLNRLSFLDHLESRIEVGRVRHDWRFAIFFLDMDQFHLANESLGHAGGDALLAETARRISRIAQRFSPSSLVARNGSDEFLVLAEGVDRGERAERLSAALDAAMRDSFQFRGNRIAVSVSIGFALANESCLHPEDLIADAGMAMSQAKNEGHGHCVAFTSELRQRTSARRQLEEDLRNAIELGQMVMHYQPEIDLATGRIVGVEALVRWQHPSLGLVSPSEFIPMAEETGLILPLGDWGLGEACRQILRWRAATSDCDDLRVSVNLSAKQFSESGLVRKVKEVLDQTGLDPSDLRLEVTESSLMTNADQAVTTMRELRDLGVGLHMDDFGTGYSSLQYLQRFPFDMLKIDRSFVNRICENRESSAIVRTILDLARSLVMEVVAEGIETEAQMHMLKHLGCKFGQGYYFSKPQDADSISKMMGDHSNPSKPSARCEFVALGWMGQA